MYQSSVLQHTAQVWNEMTAILHSTANQDRFQFKVQCTPPSCGCVAPFQHFSQLDFCKLRKEQSMVKWQTALQHSRRSEVWGSKWSDHSLHTMHTPPSPLRPTQGQGYRQNKLYKHISSLYICKKRLSRWLMWNIPRGCTRLSCWYNVIWWSGWRSAQLKRFRSVTK